MIDRDDDPLQPSLARIAALIADLEQLPDAAAREQARELVTAVLAMHRVGLARLIALVGASDDAARVDALERDQAISLLLSLHGLHPRDLATRIAVAVDELRPALLRDGVAIELGELGALGDDTVSVRLHAAGGPVRVEPGRLRATIEMAIRGRAPEIAGVEIEGLETGPIVPASRLTGSRST